MNVESKLERAPFFRIHRRHAVLLAAGLALGRARAATAEGIEIHLVIAREQRQPSGAVTRRDFETTMLLASGESMEIDFRNQYRVNLGATDAGAAADVVLQAWDNQDDGAAAGDARVSVPFGTETTLRLLRSDNIQYPVRITATRRALPAR